MGVTERPRSLNPSKAIAMAIWPIIVHFSIWRACSMHYVACEFARAFVGAFVRSKDAQKQLARTSLNYRNKMAERFASVSVDELCEECIITQLLKSVFA